VEWAREASCLPLVRGWTDAFGVTEYGEVLVLHEEDWPGIEPMRSGAVEDVRLVNATLYEGMKRYAWLKSALPPRPSSAVTCATCAGTGTPPRTATLTLSTGEVAVMHADEKESVFICHCGGAGWLPAEGPSMRTVH